MRRNPFTIALFLFATLALRAQAESSEERPPLRATNSASAQRDGTQRIIVKYRALDSKNSVGPPLPARSRSMRELSDNVGVELNYVREMATGASVLALPQVLPLDQVESIAKKIAANPGVEYAEPDYRMYRHLTPNDPQFTNQWHLTDYVGGINAPTAWDVTTGSLNTIIAVLDTGRTAHPDLDQRMLPGYDFIADLIKANDGDGREPDASDPGDWVTSADKATTDFSTCDIEDSSWHGTMVAGVIGASSQNGRDVAGIDWAARILPVRVLGKCNGNASDIADGMMWAAGNSVPGVPDNPNPAKILNLSLGSANACPNTYRAVIGQLVAAGKIVVVSAGNDNNNADHSPAGCPGVINVTAVGRSGSKASYANFGSRVTLAAPGGEGGNLVTLGNTGRTVPGLPTVTSTSGTSFSAPVVTGIISLMLAIRPELDSTAVTRILAATARPFPDVSCDTSICGAGIVDAAAALRATRDQSLGVATSVGFADADVGRPNADLALRVTNLAASPVTISGAPFISGIASADFLIPGNTCANTQLAPNGACDITLRFNPTAKNFRQADLSFNASDGRIYRVSLAGFAYDAARISQQSAGTSSAPQYIAKGADGNYWYTQSGASRIARMTPSGAVTEFALPSSGSNPFDIIAGADGNMWFTELDAGRIGRITPNGAITEFSLPSSTSQPRGIAAGADGNIWFTEITTAKIGRITPQGVITEFTIPWTPATPRGITSGPDGNLWFTDSGGLSVGRLTPQGTFTRFSMPWASDTVRNITAGADGNLWFTELAGNRIGKITTAGAFSEFPLPRAGAGPLGITPGPDGAMWYTAINSNRVGRIDIGTGQITEYRMPSAASSPIGIVTGPNNVMWIANTATSVNKIARLSIPGVSGALNYSDMWWAGAAENGWGMSIQQHGNTQFNAIYVYDSAGKPVWYVMPGGNWNADYTSYTGPIYQPTSAPLNNYSPSQFVVGPSPGNVTLNFTSDASATLQYTINGIFGQKTIQRQTFGSGTAPLLVSDMWWGGESQNGWGINLVQQNGIVFAVWYTYGADGKTTWFVLPNGTWSGTTYSGAFYSTTGSAWLGANYVASQLAVTTAGNMSFNFANANSASMSYSFTGGQFPGVTQNKPLLRQPY